MSIPRYSREDFADAVEDLVRMADPDRREAPIPTNRLRLWAAMMSEAANRAPTHQELLAEIEAGRGA